MKVVKPNEELLRLIRQGDRVAFYNIYERYCKRLHAFVLRYLKIDADAEEIVQEVFVKLWETREKIDVYSSFESYLFSIAYNTTMSQFRKRLSEKKYLDYISSLQGFNETQDLTDEIHFNELNERLSKLLDELTPRQKEIFLLSREEGLSQAEISEKLGLSINTVKKHMVNALSLLKSRLDSDLVISILYAFLFF